MNFARQLIRTTSLVYQQLVQDVNELKRRLVDMQLVKIVYLL